MSHYTPDQGSNRTHPLNLILCHQFRIYWSESKNDNKRYSAILYGQYCPEREHNMCIEVS